jgi:hypothetical protein
MPSKARENIRVARCCVPGVLENSIIRYSFFILVLANRKVSLIIPRGAHRTFRETGASTDLIYIRLASYRSICLRTGDAELWREEPVT